MALLLWIGAPAPSWAQDSAQPQASGATSPGDTSGDAPGDAPGDTRGDAPGDTSGDATGDASGDAPAEPQLPPDERPSAADFQDAPPPEQASGVVVERTRRGGWRAIPRALLFVPRWVLEGVFFVPRGALYVYDKYQLKDRVKGIFFNDEGTLGLYPLAFFETGLGLNAGLRFVSRDLLDEDLKFKARISYGGQFRQNYGAELTTGTLLGDRVSLEFKGGYEILHKSRFFGIGNRDITAAPPVGLIDPLTDDTAVETRFRHTDVTFKPTLAIKLTERIAVRVAGGLTFRNFGDNDDDTIEGDPNIRTVYDVDQLIGFSGGLSNLYTELELGYDSRRVTRFYLSPATPSTGWNARAYAGITTGLSNADPSGYVRYGADLQRYLNLYNGDRVLVLRGYLEGVTGEFAEIPFVDLPRLGGSSILRGYSRDRFRDRVAGMLSAEYIYPIMNNISGYLFGDGGRVWRELDDIGFDDLRLGFGGGLQFQTKNTFLARVTVASSIDGDVFFSLNFDPVYDIRSREVTKR